MIKMKLLLHSMLFGLLAFTACSVVVEEGNNSSEAGGITFENIFPSSIIDANTFLLGSGNRTWSTMEFTIEGINGFQNCRLDDEIELRDDNTYTYDGGTMLCGAEDSQKIKTGIWEFDGSTRTIVFDKGTEQESMIYIESLTDEEIVISSQYYSWLVVGKFIHE